MNSEVYIWVEYDQETKQWSSIEILDDINNPESQVDPVTKRERIFIAIDPSDPEKLKVMESMVKDGDISETEFKRWREDGRLELPTNPYKGSFCYHISRPYSLLTHAA